MSKIGRVVWIVVLASASALEVATAEEKAAALPASRFVAVTPCRILDTATTPPAKAMEEVVRRLDLRGTRCGRIVPPYATMYSLQVTTSSRIPPEKLPVGVLPRVQPSKVLPPHNGELEFPIAADGHVAVDIDGYYVAPGTPISAVDDGTVASSTPPAVTALSASPPSLRPGPAEYNPGSSGDIYLNPPSPPWPGAGVLISARDARPWIIAQPGLWNGWALGGFAVFKPPAQTEIMRVDTGSQGMIRAMSNAIFSGPSDYFENRSIQNNVVHNVTILNPLNSAGGSTGRVIFFNAQTDEEYGSPPTAKFRAFTKGTWPQESVNFESVFYHHRADQYYFRAWSEAEQKPTFWVKAATSLDSQTQTRADMFVSGSVGIGTVPALAKLAVQTAVNRNLEVGHTTGTGVYLEAVDRTPGTVDFSLYNGGAANLKFYTSATERVRIDAAGNVGIGSGQTPIVAKLDVRGDINVSGNINAKYQDVAEWVAASTDMAPGAVVVLNRDKNNEVMLSVTAYDTAVAGVVSARPGLLLGEASPSKEMIATTGRVKVRVDASKTPIRIGDLLVTSDRPGVAMRSEPIDVAGVKLHRPGTLIGKALEPLAGGEGEILVLLSLQ